METSNNITEELQNNNIFSSSKINWIRNENLKTDSNFYDENNTVKSTNVNINSLTKITLGEFVDKWTENSEANFLSAYPLENLISPAEIRKGEMLWSTRDFYIKGVLPGFEIRFTAKHPDYLEEDFYEVIEKNHNEDDYSGALIMKNVDNMECESGM